MKKTREAVKAINLATDEAYVFPGTYRYGVDPTHMHAPPNFTDETAFIAMGTLKDAPVGSIVFIEWCYDRFYALDAETQEYIPGPTVWRKSKIVQHVMLPADPKES